MKSLIAIPDTGLRHLARNLSAPAYTQERLSGQVINDTLEKLKSSGLDPAGRAPDLEEIVEYLALRILDGKSGFIETKG